MLHDLSLVVVGNPVDGLTFYGPFANPTIANDWAENFIKDEDWLVVVLNDPNAVCGGKGKKFLEEGR